MKQGSTTKSLFSLVKGEINKSLSSTNSNSLLGNNTSRAATNALDSILNNTQSASTSMSTIKDVLSQTTDQRILNGLTVTATDPISNNIIISPGAGTAGGEVFSLRENINLSIPTELNNSIFYINLLKNGNLNITTVELNDRLAIAKIVKPETYSTLISNTKDDQDNAYIVNLKTAKLYVDGNGLLEEDSLEIFRNNIGDVLADNIIGNIRLSENLKVTNTQGTLEMDSKAIKIYDENADLRAKFDRRGTFFYDTDGIETARFTANDSRIGNILVTNSTIQSQDFISGLSGFQITDLGEAEFNNVIVRGTIYASTGDIGGVLITDNSIESSNYVVNSSGFQFKADGTLSAFAGNIGGLKIKSNAIESSNYTSGVSGFSLNGDNGTAEFVDAIISGTIYATEGNIGGILINTNDITTSNYVSGVSGFKLTSAGDIYFNKGLVGDWEIYENKIIAGDNGTIQTGELVGLGQSGLKIDKSGLQIFNDILGRIVYLPSDGSSCYFSNGVIQNVNFNLIDQTVVRTSETVGDGTADSFGLLMNNLGLFVCGANQTINNANIKLLNTGDAYFKGTIDATAGSIGGISISENVLTGGTLIGTIIRGATIQTSDTAPRVLIDSNGVSYQKTEDVGVYGDGKYGEFKYGTGYLATIFKEGLPLFCVQEEQDEADIRLYNRLADPLSGAHELGDLIVVDGELKICTTAGSPGTFSSISGSININEDNLLYESGNVLNTIQDINSTATPTFAGLTVNGDINFNQNEAIGFVCENRTSDPLSPVTGRFWIRTDA